MFGPSLPLRLVAILALAHASPPALATVPSLAGDDEKAFGTMLAEAGRDPAHADFGKLRIAYTKTLKYQPYSVDPEKDMKINRAIAAGKFAEALADVETLLDSNPVSIRERGLAAALATKLGDEAKAKRHRQFADGLLASITKRRDGKGFKTAYEVIAVEEEYEVLESLGLGRGAQSLRELDGHDYDVFQFGGDDDPEARLVYFNIDIPRKAMERTLLGR